jgi:hypothetical protein
VDGPESSGVEYLARTAYRTYRDWTDGAKLPVRHFDQLPPEQRQAWREVALMLWREIWTNSRPPIEPTPVPRPRRSGKVSAFTLLHDDDPKNK